MGQFSKLLASWAIVVAWVLQTFTASAQELPVVDEEPSDTQITDIGVTSFGWGKFTDYNFSKKVGNGPSVDVFPIEEWELANTWTQLVLNNTAILGFSASKMSDDATATLSSMYVADDGRRKEIWAEFGAKIQEISQSENYKRIVIFAPAGRTISASTMFGEVSQDYPPGAGIQRINKQASYCFVAGRLFLFDGSTGKLLKSVLLQEDFGFMKPTAFFFHLPKEYRETTFGNYTEDQKRWIRNGLENEFLKHFKNSMEELTE